LDLDTSRAGGESLDCAISGLVEGGEHRSGHGLDVLPEDAGGLVKGSSELLGGEVEVTVTLLDKSFSFLSDVFEKGDLRSCRW